ncbi:Rrf2 family protein [uncultured Eubacteriales bacterium]|uniref:Rrf2 family protein n=1 Tax=uncultured Eubacteriales bacterium TaxID=172733 RepID=A0A212JJK8_9FIRM|nr:Rrf2 family protein [uncultured Eubacteriales bacterium]
MMISTKGRYALRVMIDLAEHQTEGYIPLKEIAERQEISEKYLESILKSLVRDKVLTGLRGKGGGYRLSKPPELCTVGSVLRLTEGSLAPVSCLDAGSEPCPRMDSCRTLPMWKKLDTLINDFFDDITIADLAAPAMEGNNYVI